MRKKLGQHFLINQTAIRKIIAELDLKKDDTLIEIGSGKGALTIPLIQKCRNAGCKIIALEKDVVLAKDIAERHKNIEVVVGDALKTLPEIFNSIAITNAKRSTEKCYGVKVVGNIPYYITGKLLRILGELEQKPELIVLTIQKEVAERICAKPKEMNPVRSREGSQRASASNGMNLLAAATQIWSKPEIVGYLKPKDFNPPPKVDSAIVKLEVDTKFYSTVITNAKRSTDKCYGVESTRLENYYRLIKICFKQPRKTVLNNLSTGLGISKEEIVEILQKCDLQGHERPQNLSLSQLIELSLALQ